MSYVSGSTPTPSGYDTQVPKPLPASAFGSADAPAVRTIQSNTSYQVIINGMKSGSYHFAIASGSVGVTIAAAEEGQALNSTTCISNVSTITFPGGSGSAGYNGSPLTIPINANVWSGSGFAGAQGDVTFVYKGGL
jgi:hypothetical protein